MLADQRSGQAILVISRPSGCRQTAILHDQRSLSRISSSLTRSQVVSLAARRRRAAILVFVRSVRGARHVQQTAPPFSPPKEVSGLTVWHSLHCLPSFMTCARSVSRQDLQVGESVLAPDIHLYFQATLIAPPQVLQGGQSLSRVSTRHLLQVGVQSV